MKVTIGEVMNNLPDGPAAGAILRIELAVCQSFDRVSKVTWQFRNVEKNPATVFCRDGLT